MHHGIDKYLHKSCLYLHFVMLFTTKKWTFGCFFQIINRTINTNIKNTNLPVALQSVSGKDFSERFWDLLCFIETICGA